MQKIVTAAEMREIDSLTTERFGLPSLLLMETAAAACLSEITARCGEKNLSRRALVLCGTGNNGGDGAALARLLWLRGWQVEAILFGRVEATRGDARTNFEIIRRLSAPTSPPGDSSGVLRFSECETLAAWEEQPRLEGDYDVVVDALFGTGLTRPLEGLFATIVGRVNSLRELRNVMAAAAKPLILSIDLPSGLNADQAQPIGANVHADLTVTFTAPKPANVLAPAARFGGQLVVASVGSPASLVESAPSQLFLIESDDARAWLRQTRYLPGSYKNTHGHAFVIAGSRGMTGAPVLCGDAAMRAGAGLVTVAAPVSALTSIAARAMPEIMTVGLPETEHGTLNAEAIHQVEQLWDRATVVAVGPGLGSPADEGVRSLVRFVVERRRAPVVLDADALNALAPWPEELRGSAERPLVLTPHEGEMRRLLRTDDEREALAADRVRAARNFATEHELILVLKGERTIVAAPDGRVFVNPTGNAGLGTAGAGDTLCGIITSFIAQAYGLLGREADALAAVLAALYVGGVAGDIAARARGMRTMTASDVRESLSQAVRQLDGAGEAP